MAAVTASARIPDQSPGHGGNRLLAALPPDVHRRLAPYLTDIVLRPRTVLLETARPALHVYFPDTAVISLMVSMEDGRSVEAAAVGQEGMLGVQVFLGGALSPCDAVVQVGGRARRMSADVLRRELGDAALRRLLARYTQALLVLAMQIGACNRLHSVVERCARWLLVNRDRQQADMVGLTQEAFATLLGVRRASVAEAVQVLQRAHLIDYRRARLRIIDRDGLERVSCECYGAIHRLFDTLFA